MNLQKKSCRNAILYSYRTFYYSYINNVNTNAMKIFILKFSLVMFPLTYSLSQNIVKLHVSKVNFFKSIVSVKIPSKNRLYHPKTFHFGTLYRKISLDQVWGYASNFQMVDFPSIISSPL
jgi:hypothetical protein